MLFQITSLIWTIAMLLAGITVIADAIVLRRRASVAVRASVAEPEPRPLTRATDLLPIVAFQMLVTALARVAALTTSPRANAVLTLLFSASLIALVTLSLGYALANLRPPV